MAEDRTEGALLRRMEAAASSDEQHGHRSADGGMGMTPPQAAPDGEPQGEASLARPHGGQREHTPAAMPSAGDEEGDARQGAREPPPGAGKAAGAGEINPKILKQAAGGR